MIAYSINPNEGYLSEKGVMALRSAFAKDIFAQDLLCEYKKQTEHRVAKLTLGHSLFQVFVGGTDQTQIDVDLVGAADGAYFALLKRAEQLHLYFVVEVPHLVEKQRAAVGRLEGTLLVLVGTRKGSLNIAEKLRGCHFAWDGAAVKGKERLVGTRA